jgi:hypothetical protein
VVGMIQLLGMLLILFLGFFNVNGSLQEFFFFFQMTWFGLTISLAFIICGNNFGWFSVSFIRLFILDRGDFPIGIRQPNLERIYSANVEFNGEKESKTARNPSD